MAGGKFSEAKLYGMTIRESADDGSDFTNPDADYRRLFLGEDGALHTRDAAGAVAAVALNDQGEVTFLDMVEAAAPATPASGRVRLYAKAGGVVASKDDAGAETEHGAGGSGGLDTGTSFPVSPLTGDRYRRSDLDYQVFFYDGARWVSETIFTLGHPLITTVGIDVNGAYYVAHPAVDIYILDLTIGVYVGTTNNGSNYWTCQLTKRAGSASPSNVGGAANTSAGNANEVTQHTVAIDTVATAATAQHFRILWSKVGSPGTVFPTAIFTYRRIAT